jgi:cysteine desulfurase/selenocysteine lyase
MPLPSSTLQQVRALFPHTLKGQVYLNHAGTSPLSTEVVQAMTSYLHERSEGTIDTYARDKDVLKECRAMVQRLINAESEDRIAFVGNTSDAINIIASGLPWQTGDRVLLNTTEFPANVYPYLNLKHSGVTVDFLNAQDGRVTPEKIEACLQPSTRLVALSAVQFLTGHRPDLRSIGSLCRDRGILFVVDGIQAAGAVQIDVQEMKIDAFAAGGQKWLMSPHGSGFLYLTENLQSRIAQRSLGWLGMDDPWRFFNYDQPLAASARRYEGGSPNMPSLRGFHASLTTLLQIGIKDIESQILSLTALLRSGFMESNGVRIITSYPNEERGGIVTIAMPPNVDSRVILKRLLSQGFIPTVREGLLRFSPHFYNTPDEMSRTVVVTREAIIHSNNNQTR